MWAGGFWIQYNVIIKSNVNIRNNVATVSTKPSRVYNMVFLVGT